MSSDDDLVVPRIGRHRLSQGSHAGSWFTAPVQCLHKRTQLTREERIARAPRLSTPWFTALSGWQTGVFLRFSNALFPDPRLAAKRGRLKDFAMMNGQCINPCNILTTIDPQYLPVSRVVPKDGSDVLPRCWTRGTRRSRALASVTNRVFPI
jgi:hypothetical protein